jgi:thiol:disulfide interchange protein/DsbC/DsbD-like thiol-disulfide interchange protein
MLKAIFLLIFSTTLWAAPGQDQFATVSLKRWDNKLVVTIEHDKGWHTYWKNPGDAGIASVFKFSQNGAAITPTTFEWPVPKNYIEAGDILTIGYSGKQHFFFQDPGGEIDSQVGFLICKDICIPGEAKLKIKAREQFVSSRPTTAPTEGELKQAFEALPPPTDLPSEFEYYLTRTKDQNLLTLHYSLKGVKSKRLPAELFFLTAFPKQPFGFKRESLYFKDDTLYGKVDIEWDGEYQEPPIELPASGNFKEPYLMQFLWNAPGSNTVRTVELKFKDFALATPALDQFYNSLTPFDGTGTSVPTTASTESGNLLQYLLLAFLGGFILNLMPCVLPVISLKLFGLIKHRDTPRKQLLAHNFAYTLGVIATFMALALVIAGLKATGEEVGWGFQLQSPAFVLVMMLMLFVLSLNLFGLFEFSTPGGSRLAGQKVEQGFSGDFFTGVLTTILATPCSAPFLGTALTFAFTASYAMIFVMFLFIGLGLAFPFLLTAFFPAALAVFPRPGAWMEKLKYILGLTLVATIVWLYDVFVSLVDFELVSWRLNLLFVFWFFAFFAYQRISKRGWVTAISFAIPISLTVLAINALEMRPTSTELKTSSSAWKPWSEDYLQQEKGKLVFMDFTAEWCLTCKVNKKLVLDTSGFENLAKKYDLVLMRADWTKRDDRITQFLKRYQAVGVPAYFVQKPDGSILFLGETITLDKIEKHLN